MTPPFPVAKTACLAMILSAVGLPAFAQDQASGGTVSAALAYSMERGAIAGLGLDARSLFGTGFDLSLRGNWDERGREISANLRSADTFDLPGLNRPATLRFSLQNRLTEWEDDAFSTSRTGASVGVEFALGTSAAARTDVFIYDDRIYDVDATTSAFIAAEAGTRVSSGLAFGWAYDTTDNPMAPREGLSLDAELRLALWGDDARWSALGLSAAYHMPVGQDGTVRVGAIGGLAEGWNGSALRITERAFLASDLPRGFAAGGIGPRDLATDTALGGERYAAFSLEYARDIGNVASAGLRGHVFAEAGSVWQLQNTGGGVVDDSLSWRTSAGVALSIDTSLGLIELYAAHPIDYETYDETQSFGLSLRLDF